MAEYDTVRRASAGVQSSAIDEGLRAHMNRVYGLMSMGMIITGIIAYIVGTDLASAKAGQPTMLLSPEILQTMFSSPIRYVIMFAPLAVVFAFGAGINRMSENTARLVFMGFSALMGLSISWIFAVYTGISIANTFFVTAIAFAGLSLWGYTTKKDISGWGSFLIMGVIGLIVASIVNIFLASGPIAFAISALGILIFAGLTAYDTQNIKNTYLQMASNGQTEWLGKAAIMGALNLYLDFLNMFMFMLQFLGGRE
ncbi:Bax inhibitor-1/YccA family protein [Amylibacter sp. SFDW26]|uniref:Bax inhibitor-1/YccA family protein n=1 Tax=Amylibacter sp. SFDW26 TaxID=2652722 RepID=UPI001261950D|nr:Bax inhibitor-1/YccA family protein [Amylibacter sp. SFDW26]KAB7616215.1 Bax inhibitor-1/YccA family protein [Amylibacter sp. SFDW26]